MLDKQCPCQSGKMYTQCCAPFICGETLPSTAEKLMRSRYTAYTQGNSSYLIATWHPDTVPLDLSFDGNTVNWKSLSILSTELGQQTDHEGKVEFEARFQAGNQTSCMRENSRFTKVDARWYYVDGEVDRAPNKTVASPRKVGRNEPCSCGSGKKFKRCCG
jgi:SEC-C motif-containing protein